MAIQLAIALELSSARRDELLQAAGFASLQGRSDDAGIPPPMIEAIRRMMAQHEPYPLCVCNRARDIVHANAGALRVLAAVLNGRPPPQPFNMLRLLFDPAFARPFVENWEQLATYMRATAQRDALRYPDDRLLAARLREIERFETSASVVDPEVDLQAVLTIRLATDSLRASFFTTATTFAGPQSSAVEGLMIESWFPLDAETDALCLRLAAGELPIAPQRTG